MVSNEVNVIKCRDSITSVCSIIEMPDSKIQKIRSANKNLQNSIQI